MNKKVCEYCGGSGWVPHPEISGYKPLDFNIFNYQGDWNRCRCNPQQPGVDKKDLIRRLDIARELISSEDLAALREILLPVASHAEKLLIRDAGHSRHINYMKDLSVHEQQRYIAGVLARMLLDRVIHCKDVADACSVCIGRNQ